MIPATGVRPPLLMFVIVRAMAPVAGIPPKIGEARLAIPCAISSVLELCLSPMTPSATVAESNDSMAPRMAIVMAGDTSDLMTSHVSEGTSAPGNWLDIENLSPIVSIDTTPAYCFSSRAAIVITIIAISEPGSFDNAECPAIFGHKAIIATLNTPTPALQLSIVGNAPT